MWHRSPKSLPGIKVLFPFLSVSLFHVLLWLQSHQTRLSHHVDCYFLWPKKSLYEGAQKRNTSGKTDDVTLFRRDTMHRASNAKETLEVCERPQKTNINNCRSPHNKRDKQKEPAKTSNKIYNKRTRVNLRELRSPLMSALRVVTGINARPGTGT